MLDTGIYVLLSIWSIGIMSFIFWKLKMNHFKEQMKECLTEAAIQELKEYRDDADVNIKYALEDRIKEYLIESKVVDRTVTFRWVRKEDEDE